MPALSRQLFPERGPLFGSMQAILLRNQPDTQTNSSSNDLEPMHKSAKCRERSGYRRRIELARFCAGLDVAMPLSLEPSTKKSNDSIFREFRVIVGRHCKSGQIYKLTAALTLVSASATICLTRFIVGAVESICHTVCQKPNRAVSLSF